MSGSPGDVLRIVRGKPTDAEVAALVVALHARSAVGRFAQPSRPSAWADPARALRQPPRRARPSSRA